MHNKKLLWAVIALFPLAAFSLFIGVANISLESFLAGMNIPSPFFLAVAYLVYSLFALQVPALVSQA